MVPVDHYAGIWQNHPVCTTLSETLGSHVHSGGIAEPHDCGGGVRSGERFVCVRVDMLTHGSVQPGL